MDFFSSTPTTRIYTDGSCLGKTRCGGWAARIHVPEQDPVSIADGEPTSTTNNRMEILAAIRALEWLEVNHSLASFPILIFTDSKYLAENFSHVATWRKRDWMTLGSDSRAPSPVLNRDLWEALDSLGRKSRGVQCRYILRSSDPENVVCDKLAHQAARVAEAGLP